MMMRGGAKKCSQSQVTYLRNRTTVEQVDLLPSLSLQYVSAHHIRGICGIGELLRLLVIKESVWVGLCVCGLVRMYRSDIVCWPHCGLVSKSIVMCAPSFHFCVRMMRWGKYVHFAARAIPKGAG